MPASGKFTAMWFMISIRISRSCVDHAVDSHATVSTPSTTPTGVECFAVSSPAIAVHDDIRSPCASGAVQPSFTVRESRTSPRSCGSRPLPNGIASPLGSARSTVFRMRRGPSAPNTSLRWR